MPNHAPEVPRSRAELVNVALAVPAVGYRVMELASSS
jgi:hypothetical protein